MKDELVVSRYETHAGLLFHGTLDEVRIDRGTLDDDPIAELAGRNP
jgi:hypothetical protein